MKEYDSFQHLSQHKELQIVIKVWVYEWDFRAFLEALVAVVGNQKPYSFGYPPSKGSIHINEDGRLDEIFWQDLKNMLPHTDMTACNLWAGFCWKGKCEVRCEVQLDMGYDGVYVVLEVPDHWGSRVEVVVNEFRPK